MLELKNMMNSEYVQDLIVVATMAAVTTTIRHKTWQYFEHNMPDFQKLRHDVKSRMAVEIAVIPTRIILVFLTLPIVLRGFQPIDTWTAADTQSSLLACAVLTGTYIVDLTVTRNDKGSTLHHCMGPALLVWIRTCFSTYTPRDALLCRLLMSFVFIGGTVSGATTTALTFLFRLRQVWFKSRTWGGSKNAYFCFTLLLPVLALSTITGTFYATAYLNYWFAEIVEYFGYWGYLPLGALLLECGMQWKWILWFYTVEAQYRSKFNDDAANADSSEKVKAVAAGAWWLPSWRFFALKALALAWLLTAVALPWRHGDVHALFSLMALPLTSNLSSLQIAANGTVSTSMGKAAREL